MTSAVDRLARSVAALGLTCTATEPPPAPLPDDEWQELLRVVRSQRLAGHLADGIASGIWPATPAQAAQAAEEHVAAMCGVLVLEATLLDVVDLLSEAGVDYRVLKGSAVAHLDYADPSLRSFGDVDLIVPSEHFDEAVRVLSGTGNRRQFPQPRPGFDRRFSKGTSFTTPDSLEIDLHRTFVMGPYGLRVELADLWREHAEFTLAGHNLHALVPEQRFLHACFHAALGDSPPRLVPLRDVAEMLLARRFDQDKIRTLCAAWQAEAVVARAIGLAWEYFELGDANSLTAWALHYQPDAVERKYLSVYLDAGRSYAGKSLAALRVIPGVRNKAAFVWALTFPQSSYVAGRHNSNRRRWRRAASTLMSRGHS